ncbi:ABC transporter related protein [Arcobacter nitrofigilis DSM 7299]|uniref:ABC transporter related protein n=1 Tax=Arcobacter nitrofigilis (strain ATCC 33309 / DSM 7299 / CCUG 15893 / LMG 7604 / NCTC 12251 / CI) TaxID=572480 RepID=D5V715_ARCNC|nr:ATP-binding cassette domain-containing protein [Arcobacter nitrofigilis]ADG94435.1 ABC transporter related protein [Arcobacter nitrofigilis DSM 7299]
MKNNILNFKNVDYSYGQKVALNNVSFSIEEGTFSVLLGLNGAGKSTIFSLITRLQNLQKGEIDINGYPIKNYSKALKDIGIVFQEPTLDLDLTVKQNLFYYGSLKGLSFKQTLESIDSQITRLELDEVLNTQVRKLNGGHRRRVEILRALINKPKLLLLDEPTVGLDVKSRFDILNYVRNLVKQDGISVLWITHLFDEVNLEDNISIIKSGQIVDSGIVQNLMQKYEKDNLIDTFNFLVG